MNRYVKYLLPAAVAVLLAAGCAAPNTSGISAGIAPDESGLMETYLDVDNARLARNLVVEDVRAQTAKNGILKATVRLKSLHNKTVTVQSKFSWFDADGVELEADGNPWSPLVLHGRESRAVQGLAPNTSAVSFKLHIRSGEKTKKFM